MPHKNSLPSSQGLVNTLRLAKGKHCESVIIYANYSIKSLFLSHVGDPLIHHGQHFGQMVHSMCNVQVLIMKSIEHLAEEGLLQKSH